MHARFRKFPHVNVAVTVLKRSAGEMEADHDMAPGMPLGLLVTDPKAYENYKQKIAELESKTRNELDAAFQELSNFQNYYGEAIRNNDGSSYCDEVSASRGKLHYHLYNTLTAIAEIGSRSDLIYDSGIPVQQCQPAPFGNGITGGSTSHTIGEQRGSGETPSDTPRRSGRRGSNQA